MYDSPDEAIACPKGNICLVENLKTGLVYNDDFSSSLMIYDQKYQNEQGESLLFQQHLNSMATVIQKTMGRGDLIEVGCGKGFFLEMLSKQGVDVKGFDPTYEGNNSRIKQHSFEPGLGLKAKGIILRHVLEHIQNPVKFLMHLSEANGGEGLIYIEVPCLDWICKHRAWFDVYYEHVNYFRISDFYRMFESVLESGTAFGSQYLYIVADLATLRPPIIDSQDRVCFPGDFLGKLNEMNMGACTAVWGAASKGVIFSLLKHRVGQPIDVCIDINPGKQGKFIAATGTPVLPPGEGISKLPKGSTVYVSNSNYLEEIKTMSDNAFNYVSIDDA